jgi:hypothetical protein
MKYLYVLLLPVLVCSSAAAQDKPLEDVHWEWISRFKYDRITCDTLYYTESINTTIIDSMIQRIAASPVFKIHFLYTNSNAAPLTLTKEEQQYIVAELEKLKTYKWKAGLFPQSRMIVEADIESVLARTETLRTEKERNLCSIIYTFSNPIFIREGSICLYLDQERYRTNYTQLDFGFYTKENNRWQKYAQAYSHYESEKAK